MPLAFWVLVQKTVVNITYEKFHKLQEALKMWGVSDSAYWTSYFISDGILIGFLVSFLCTITTTYGLFGGANFGVILGFLYLYILSATTFGFFLCSFFDTPQSSGQITLLVLIGCYVTFIAANISTRYIISITCYANYYTLLWI